MKNTLAAVGRVACTILAAFIFAAPAFPQEIRLIAKDGSFDMVGTLLSAENSQLTVSTILGEITLDQKLVVCEGAACPKGRTFDYDFSIAAPGDVAELLVPILLDGFATDRDAEAIVLDEMGDPIDEEAIAGTIRNGVRIPLQMLDFDGEEVGIFGVQETTATESYDLLAASDVSVVFADVPATPGEVQKVAAAGGGDLQSFEQEHVIAVDGLAVIGHPDNAVERISVPEAAAIMAGRITNWSQVRGPNAPINIYSFAAGSEALRDVEALLLAPYRYQLSPTAKIVATPQELAAAVTADPNGIAVVAYHSKRDARAIPLSNECGMVVAPSPFTIKTEEYPLEKRIVAYNRADAFGIEREFLDELDGDRLDGLVSKAGFIDLSVVPESPEYAAARIEAARFAQLAPGEAEISNAMIAEMGQSDRLSTTFRFAPGSSLLDNRARRDLARMVAYIGEQKPTDVYVVGFADSGGSFNQNQGLSEQRAQQIANQLAEAALNGEMSGVTVAVRGYSELSPVACNDTLEGRAINRRVEIWVR